MQDYVKTLYYMSDGESNVMKASKSELEAVVI